MNSLLKVCLLSFTLTVALLQVSCRNETDLSGIPDVKFSTDIEKIISSKCSYAGCHGNNGGQGSLVGYDAVMAFGEVKAGDARKSKLYRVITNRSSNTMPPAGNTEISNEEIKLIYIWIEQGAKNN